MQLKRLAEHRMKLPSRTSPSMSRARHSAANAALLIVATEF
jgi:hypothetical protein